MARLLRFIALLLPFLLATPGNGQLRLPQGFSAQVFYASGAGGKVRQPTSLEFDNLGQLFVAQLRGNISILEDMDGDGEADRVQEFASGLRSITGLALRAGEVYASSRGSVVRLRDTDADGVADERETIINRLPIGRHQNNGIAFGPDGLLYHCVGSRNDGSETDLVVLPAEASIVRANPDGSNLEVFATGLRNCYDLAFHPLSGQLYATDNGRDVPASGVPEELNLIVEAGEYGWPDCWGASGGSRCEGTLPPVAELQAHASADGLSFYHGTQFPKRFRNNLFIAMFGANSRDPTIGKRVVRVELIGPAGGEARITDFALGFDNPLDLTIGPDGSLYVADFGADTIYRISYVGTKGESEPEISIAAKKSSYRIGDTLVLDLGVRNPSQASEDDLYIAILLPDGRFVTIPVPLEFSEIGAIRVYRAPLPVDQMETIVRFPIDAALAAGEYHVIAVLARSGSDPALSANQLFVAQRTFAIATE